MKSLFSKHDMALFEAYLLPFPDGGRRLLCKNGIVNGSFGIGLWEQLLWQISCGKGNLPFPAGNKKPPRGSCLALGGSSISS